MKEKGIIRETFEGCLIPGKKYLVTKSFIDAAKSVHREGEVWTYLGFCPNGFSESTYIYISTDKNAETGFGIDWNSSKNNLGLENVRNYVQEL